MYDVSKPYFCLANYEMFAENKGSRRLKLDTFALFFFAIML